MNKYETADARHWIEDDVLLLERRVRFVQANATYDQEGTSREWKRRKKFLKENGVGMCRDYMFDIIDYALLRGVRPEMLRYAIITRRKPRKNGRLQKSDEHAVGLYFGRREKGEVVCTTGVLSDKPFCSLTDMKKQGWKIYVSWHKPEGKLKVYLGRKP